MADYYIPNAKRTSAKTKNKTPYLKIFLRQLIAAIVCFLIINYASTTEIKMKIKEIINYSIDTTKVSDFFNQMKTDGDDTSEIKTETETKL